MKIFYKKDKDEEVKVLDKPCEGCWVHLDEATSSDLGELGKFIGMDYSDLQDCLDKYEIPRIERVDSHVMIYTRYPTDQEIGLYTSTLTMIVTRHYFVTISPHRCLLIKNFLTQKNFTSTLEPKKLLIQLLFKINQEFTGQIRRLRYNILSAEKEMVHVDSEDITVLIKNEEILNQYYSSLIPMRTVIDGIRSLKSIAFDEQELESLEDLLNSVKQSEELCSIVLKSIRSLRDSYQSMFANNLHKTIKLLTALTIILNIPTMIASIYGMNVNLPFVENAYAFEIIFATILIVSVLGFYIFKRKKWM
ncbi:MAG TPA: magnesium transporter CorA family protein [Rhabdochlamydiaceae bacterium]|nr:magnesium transporter CorA family protein [Rhabdochlamydiaceae bacterium]